MNTHALRYYPFETNADSIVRKIIEKKAGDAAEKPCLQYDVYRKTAIDWVIHREFLTNQIRKGEKNNAPIYQHIIKPYLPWLKYAHLQQENTQYLTLTTALFENYYTYYSNSVTGEDGRLHQASRKDGLYRIFGEENMRFAADKILGEIDLFKRKNNILQRLLPGALNEEAASAYCYFLSGEKTENGERVHEIAFYTKNPQTLGFEGFLYVSADGRFALRKAVFSINSSIANSFMESVLFIQRFDVKKDTLVPAEQKSYFTFGDDINACFQVTQTTCHTRVEYSESLEKEVFTVRKENDYLTREEIFWENHRPVPLTAAESEVKNITATALQTPAFRHTENLLYLLLSDHLRIGGHKGTFEWGNVSQTVSYNETEGLRLKAGGNTTSSLNKHFLLGGYVAYGLKDKKFKYRSNIIYSFRGKDNSIWEYPRSILSFTYADDLNRLGDDLLTSTRDNLFHSDSSDDLSRQKIGRIAFEQEILRNFSFKIEGKYWREKPAGTIQHKPFTNSELSFSFQYAPQELFVQIRENRIYIQQGNIQVNLKHRTGLKGIFGSEYNYHITEGNIYKTIYFPKNAGHANIELSAGKVWNRLPYSLLLIPHGEKSYLFDKRNYNLMNPHEFVTDNFVGGNMNIFFNWSPVRLFDPQSIIRTSIGGRMICGALSGNNNPDLHQELFPFGNTVNPLGKTPYIEVNAGFANIFQIFRIEYVRRLTYPDNAKAAKGSLFVTIDLTF
jgi:hypothetical protein